MPKGSGAPALAQYWDPKKQDGRAYKNPFTDERVPSVTTITGMEDKPALVQYAADRTAIYATENWMTLGSKSDQSAFNQLRYRHKDVVNDLAQVGTDAHAWVEADLLQLWDDMPPVEGAAQECVDQWIALRNSHVIDPLYVETTAWSYQYGFAGTLDLSCLLDGVPTLGDAKTSRGLWDSHRMQLAALWHADKYMIETEDGEWDEVDPPVYEQAAFFHLRPTFDDPLRGIHEEAYWEIVYLDLDELDGLFEQFLGYLKAFNGKQQVKSIRREKEKLAQAGGKW